MEPLKIKKLEQDVINRIAAGEVIQRPCNALKELIENSLDAKSSNIQITVKNGGLKLLQIQDNGVGIRKEDFEIICERFTTSKLSKFEDLNSMTTYGFRGEALASISHIAHLTIISKTINEICAYQASYVDSKLQGSPKPTAGNQGTIIIVEDLFYNMNVRKNALRSPVEEYQKIADVVNKYAVHNARVGFALKKFGESNDIRTPENSSTIENIKIMYGTTITRELIEFSLENKHLKFNAKCFMTNVNYSTKKMQFLLFINHRLVDCQSLKRAIDQVFSTYLPKSTHPFVYMNLKLDPASIDVNVHPTKHEVHFINEEKIIDSLVTAIESKLLGSESSRAFLMKGKLPKTGDIDVRSKKKTKINPQVLVRTDFKEQKLDKFFSETGKSKYSTDEPGMSLVHISLANEEEEESHRLFLKGVENLEGRLLDRTENDIVKQDSIVSPTIENTKMKPFKCDLTNELNEVSQNNGDLRRKVKLNSPKDLLNISEKEHDKNSFLGKIIRIETKLTSILELRKEIEDNSQGTLREILAQHVFVGSITPNQALIQYSTKLYLCNTKKILSELLYQLMMYNFQNFSCYNFSNKISIFELAMIALDKPEAGWTPEDGEKAVLAKRITEILTEKGPMLEDYFSMVIDEAGNLLSIPIILDNYMPDPRGLPMFILRLATEVDWENEKRCFESFARETVEFYSTIPIEDNHSKKNWKWVVEHIIYPSVKEYFIPPNSFLENAAVLEIANLPNLYKVFERC